MGIDINEGINGVDEPHNIHVYTYTAEYDDILYNRLKDKLTPESFRDELDKVYKQLSEEKDLFGNLIPKPN